ncbi:Pentatricopeptide repeat-containing protein [Durusdinium trenchii]|uniref:Pentatricopeptide repeat-containing protein n=1 Tax=Durusdinium trenchii TaxID=1381693 RepID=A0ABP0PZC4_9DINO
MALVSAALGATALFGYNRENFQFDKRQMLQRETLRLNMQLKRFALFRDDVRDLVTLTVDRMDVYHLIGALFMKFCIIVFCKGRIQASAPPFVLQLFQLSNACAFMYLLLAVWLSMHASIASHSFGVKMLTRFVRLPIPTQKQLTVLQSKLIDFEKQGIAQMMRLPFQDHQDWEAVRGKEPGLPPQAKGPIEKAASAASLQPVSADSASAQDLGSEPMVATVEAGDAGTTSAMLLDSKETKPFEDLLSSSRGAMPERHVQLFRQLQFKWQCYDAYCRVCLGLGLNHILQALTYYCICHALVENRTPSLGFGLVVLFQAATIFVAFLDLAGLQHREIITVQIVSILPSLATALEVSLSPRDEEGKLIPHQELGIMGCRISN